MFKKVLILTSCFISLSSAMKQENSLELSKITKAAICSNSLNFVSFALNREKSMLEDAYRNDCVDANAEFDRKVEYYKFNPSQASQSWLSNLQNKLEEDIKNARQAHTQRIERFHKLVVPAYVAYARSMRESAAFSETTVYTQAFGLSLLTSWSFGDLIIAVSSGNIVNAPLAFMDTMLFGRAFQLRMRDGIEYEKYVEKCKARNDKICEMIASCKVVQ